MKRIVLVLLLIVVLVMSFAIIKAADSVDDQGNPNDPAVNDRANACYTGGSLEGKCDSDLLWAAGWYLIRFEHGMITRHDFPGLYVWVLPPEIKQQVTGYTTPADPTSCTIELIDHVAADLGMPTVNKVSLDLINGTAMSDGYFNWATYKLFTGDIGWRIIASGNQINLVIWDKGFWADAVTFTDCPNPINPVTN